VGVITGCAVRLDLEEYLEDLRGQVFGLVKALWIVAERILYIEGVLVCDLEGEVARLAIEGGVAGDAEALGVVEDDDGILVGDVGVEPGKAAAGEFDFGCSDGLDGGVGGGDVALKLTLDLADVLFETADEGGEKGLALSGDDAGLVLRASVLFGCFVGLLLDVLR